MARIKQHYDFLGFKKTVEEVITEYDLCRRGKSRTYKLYRLLQLLLVVEQL